MSMIFIRKVFVATALCISPLSVAAARDFKPIAEYLRPAYFAMNLTLLCAQDDPWFLTDSSGLRGNAIEYAGHVRGEVIASLSNNDSIAVLKLAADEARYDARLELRKIVPTQSYRYSQIAAWCRSHVLGLVRNFAEKHEMDHIAMLRRLDEEKQKLKAGSR